MRTKRIEAVLTQVKAQGGDALALMPGPNLGLFDRPVVLFW